MPNMNMPSKEELQENKRKFEARDVGVQEAIEAGSINKETDAEDMKRIGENFAKIKAADELARKAKIEQLKNELN